MRSKALRMQFDNALHEVATDATVVYARDRNAYCGLFAGATSCAG